MIGPWDRIEASSHDDELDAGVEARIADPLWMLARQWQVGELRGDDAARPVAARIEHHDAVLTTYQPGDGPPVPMPGDRPLEEMVEGVAPPRRGGAGLRWSTRLAAQISRRLTRAGLGEAIGELNDARALELRRDDAVAMPGPGTTVVELLRRRSFDGAALLDATSATTESVLSDLDYATRNAALTVIDGWRDAVRARFGQSAADAWDEHRLEHRFSVTASTAVGDVVLTADEYLGGHLDWYSFDIAQAERAETPPPTAATDDESRISKPRSGGSATPLVVTAIPTPVRYAGMPASRWWAFEEGDVHFGDLAASPGDLGRLLVADYATVYGNDWFSVPLRIAAGTLSQVQSLRVHDTMGGDLDVTPAAILDRRERGDRAFRLYELTGDPSVAAGRAPFLFVPPSLSGSAFGPVLERVELIRDEAANLAWGVERIVEGPTGMPVDRLQHWRTTEHQVARGIPDVGLPSSTREGPTSPVAGGGDGASGLPGDDGLPHIPTLPDADEGPGRAGSDELWRYRLETTAPPYWVPFVAARVASGAQVRLRRARMQEWDVLDPILTGPKGELLQRDQPMMVEEEEVPRGGATLERRWQAARWSDGSLHVWLQRSKRPGRGERSAGLRWDTLDR